LKGNKSSKYKLEISNSDYAGKKDYVQDYIQLLNSKFKSRDMETVSEDTSKLLILLRIKFVLQFLTEVILYHL